MNKERTGIFFFSVAVMFQFHSYAGPQEASIVNEAHSCQRGPNLILTNARAKRWNALSCPGYKMPSSLQLDKLAGNAGFFENNLTKIQQRSTGRARIFTSIQERTRQSIFEKAIIKNKFVSTSYSSLLTHAGYSSGFLMKFGNQQCTAYREYLHEVDVKLSSEDNEFINK